MSNKPKFDPNQAFESAAPAKPKFDPNQKFEAGAQPSGEGNQLAAGLQGFGNGLMLGYAPQVQAALEKPLAHVFDFFTGNDVASEVEPDYVKRRDEWIKRQNTLIEENPKTYAASNIAGSVVGGLATPGGALAKGATKLGTIGRGAAIGATLGAVSNPGDTEGKLDPLQLDERLWNAGMGGLMGGATPALGTAAEKAGAYLRTKAREKAFKALGPYARDAMKAFDKGQIDETGRVLLDEGVVGGLPTSYQGLAKRAEKALESKGEKIGQYINDLDDQLQAMNLGGEPGLIPAGQPMPPQSRAGISRKMMADAVKEDLISPHVDLPGVPRQNTQVETFVSGFENQGNPMLSLREAQAKKQALKQMINWDRLPGADIPLEEQVNRSLYNKVSTGIEDAAEALDSQLHGGAGQYRDLKTEYGALSRASEIANRREAKEFANRLLSPSDYWATGLGAAGGFSQGNSIEERLGNAAMGASLGIAHKGIRQYGNQVIAPALNKVASGLMKIPKFADLAQRNPMAFQRMVHDMASNPRFTPKDDQATPDAIRRPMSEGEAQRMYLEEN